MYAQATRPDERRWWVLAILSLSVLIIVVDDTIIVVALPVIQASLGASPADLQWTLNSYLLVFAGLLLPAGTLGDRFGRKRALQAGLVVFGLGSLASAFAPSVEWLIVGRGVMGVGAAFIMPTTLSILTNVFPPEERVRAIAIWSGVVGVGVGIGPVTGGVLLEQFWWGAAFLINVPIVLMTVGLAAWMVTESREPDDRPIDVLGACLSMSGLGALIYAIIEAPSHGWADRMTLVPAAVGVGLLSCFALWEKFTDHPMLNPHFFRSARFTISAIALMLTFFALLGLLFVSTQLLQVYHGYSPMQAGLRTAPVAFAIMGGALLSSAIAERIGAKIAVAVGLALISVGISTVAMTGDTGYMGLFLGIIAVGFGMGIAMTPATDAIMGSLPAARAGVGSAINDTTRQVGAALGVAVVGSLLSYGYTSALSSDGQNPTSREVRSLAVSLGEAARMDNADGVQLAIAAREAFTEAMKFSLLVAAGAALLAAVLALMFLPAREPRTAEEISSEFMRGTLPRGVQLRDWLLRPLPPRPPDDDWR